MFSNRNLDYIFDLMQDLTIDELKMLQDNIDIIIEDKEEENEGE